jgi:hypothetical protein
MVFQRKKTHMGKFKKRWFGPFNYNIAYPIILFFFFFLVNNFEPNPILVNVNKLKPYTYVVQTLEGMQSLEDQKYL